MKRASDNRWHSQHRRPDRRAVLGTLAAGVTLGLAGCVGGDDDDPGDETNGDDPGDETTALDNPAEFPEDGECAVCNMNPAQHQDWNAQLVKTDETRVFVCSSGCLLAYVTNPEHFGGDDEAVENIWVTDYETGELIDGMDAYYARVEDPDHVDDIMMMNPTPFETRASGESFLEQLNTEHDAAYDPEEDVITYDDFDHDLAVHYRANFFDDESDDGGNDH